jgi:polyisoprenoid-binding protein YceI
MGTQGISETATIPQTRTAWAIDASHSAVEFGVKHMMFTTVKGRFAGIQGTIELDEQDVTRSRVEVEIDVASVDTRDEKRDAHLRSPDFFDAEQFPTIAFRSTRVEQKGSGDLRVIGDLTIHGVTREVILDATRTGQGTNPWGMEVIGFEATTRISRKTFGMEFNVPLDGGGVLVGDEIKIALDIQAVKQN